jgi:hypothetical protein
MSFIYYGAMVYGTFGTATLSLTILAIVGIDATLRIESRYAECHIFTPHPKRRYVGSRGDGKFDSPVPKRLSNHSPSAKHFHSVSNQKKKLWRHLITFSCGDFGSK